MSDKPQPLSAANSETVDAARLRGEHVKVSLTKSRWIERYGGQKFLDREGLEVVACTDCDDSICHGWKLVPARGPDGTRASNTGESNG